MNQVSPWLFKSFAMSITFSITHKNDCNTTSVKAIPLRQNKVCGYYEIIRIISKEHFRNKAFRFKDFLRKINSYFKCLFFWILSSAIFILADKPKQKARLNCYNVKS